MALGLPSSGSSGGSDLSLGSMGSTPGGMTGGSFPFGSMGPTDISGMGMGLPTSIALDTPFATSDSHNQNGIGSLPMTSHDADVSSTRESLGSLGQLPRNFSLSDLTAELTNGAGKTQKKPLVITGELLHIFLQRVRVQFLTLTLCCVGLYLVCHFLTFCQVSYVV